MKNFFSIGMTKQAVLSKMSLDSTNSTTKTRQLIQNFWKTDDDGKITNEIELAMLNSWANGSEKVKMPLPSSLPSWSSEGTMYVSDSASDKKATIIYDTNIDGQNTISWYMVPEDLPFKDSRQDFLQDWDNDGYADRRIYIKGRAYESETALDIIL